jgi:hypothetical protein
MGTAKARSHQEGIAMNQTRQRAGPWAVRVLGVAQRSLEMNSLGFTSMRNLLVELGESLGLGKVINVWIFT